MTLRTATPLSAISGPKKIGPYEIHTIESGSFALDGGAMFGIVPKTIWDRTNPADELNRIDMRLRCLLLIERNKDQSIKKAILVDNGIGTKWAEKFMQIYKIDHSTWALDLELAKLGLNTESITDLIGTHFHFDHMGGTSRRVPKGGKKIESTQNNSDFELVPTFPNAKLWIQEQNWDNAYHPNEKDRASYLKENFDMYRESRNLNILTTAENAREEILPGIFVRVSNGHTRGMQLVEVCDNQNSVLYCADAIPTSTHVKVPFIMGYDCLPLKMIEEKKIILKEAEERGMLLFMEHCPRSEAVSVFHDGKDFAVKEAFSF